MKYPIEFYHYQNDWQLRDAQKARVLKVDSDGLDFLQQKAAIELLEKIVSLLNQDVEVVKTSPDVSPVIKTTSDLIEKTSNDDLRSKLGKTDLHKFEVLEKRFNRFKEKMVVKYAEPNV